MAFLGHVVQSEYHVLRRNGDRGTVGWVEDVVRGEHQQLGFQDGFRSQRQVYGHLVAVEVGVEPGADQRVQLDGLSFDQARLESLDGQTVQRRGAVEQYRMALDDVFQDVPYHRVAAVDDLLGALDRLDDAALDEFADDERFVELGRHVFGQPAFVDLEFRSGNDDRTGGVVHTFTQQVLTETTLFSFQRVGERLERPVGLGLDGRSLAGVVEERIDRFLQHALFVAQDHLRRFDLDQAFEAVVADDHPAVQVVEVRSGKTASVERHQRAQLGRNDGNDLHDHPFRTVFTRLLGLAERLDDLQAFECFGLALFGGFVRNAVAQFIGELV